MALVVALIAVSEAKSFRGDVEGSLSDAHCLGCDPNPPRVSRGEHLAKSGAFFSQQILFGDPAIFKNEFCCSTAAYA